MTIYDYTATTITGEKVSLGQWRGRVLLIVNTASACGFTPQYAGLQALYTKYEPRGLTILGFPCNQFGEQEKADEVVIGAFCEKNYGVTFPLFAKVDVNGASAHELFRYLTKAQPGILGTQAIKWNFTKFLVDRQGNPVNRFAPQTKPADLEKHIEKLL